MITGLSWKEDSLSEEVAVKKEDKIASLQL